jgi:RES domain-containing protein
MPIVWRLTRPQFADKLDGAGARLFGGRWNSRGRSAVYTSSHLSLSVLEAYVNIPPELRDDLPVLQAVQISVPDDAKARTVRPNELAGLMKQADPIAASRAIGNKWIEAQAELVLVVPSILVPEETNLILNPAHSGMRDVAIVSTRRFRFDSRLVAPTA